MNHPISAQFSSIEQISNQYLSSNPVKNQNNSTAISFEEILKEKRSEEYNRQILENSSLKFSKHAAMRLTDRSGQIAPIEIPVPDLSESQSPEPGEKPFTSVNLYAHLKGYEQIESENLQVFADTTTLQNLEMIPLAELPQSWSQNVIINTPPQNL